MRRLRHYLISVVLVVCALAGTAARITYDHGGIVRADRSRNKLALAFTGGDYGEGTAAILDTLRDERVPASLFVTGGFLRRRAQAKLLRRAVREGHRSEEHT